MASEFDSTLKKRKKKKVDFIEDPLGADADPTKPAPETIDSTTINGERVDLGPTTAHEMMSQSETTDKGKEADDFKAMFGDVKRKKKKKDISKDLVKIFISILDGTTHDLQLDDSVKQDPVTTEKATGDAVSEGPTITADDIDFSSMKKKKGKKKVDLEAFEKELNDSKDKSKADEAEEEDEAFDSSHLDNIDEAELGDDPFARPTDAPPGVDAGNEAWLKSDRDYIYEEARFSMLYLHLLTS